MSMTILTVGIDLAKNVLAVRGVNKAGKAELFGPDVPATSFTSSSPRCHPV